MNCPGLKKLSIINYALLFLLSSCAVSKQIASRANIILLQDSVISRGHIGVSIYEPATGKYWYAHDAGKYFIPASNTKLFTLYAGMKYLGDSLVGVRVQENWDGVAVYGTGDPTFLHPDFGFQPVYDYLRSKKGSNVTVLQNEDYNNAGSLKPYGKGWTWDDYDQEYMPERSFFPLYGNLVHFSLTEAGKIKTDPPYFKDYDWWNKEDSTRFSIAREAQGNLFRISGGRVTKKPLAIPFKTTESYGVSKFTTNIIAALLSDTLGYTVTQATTGIQFKNLRTIHSQPVDSLFKPMMHRSDNFFAEQTLLMVSNEQLGYMSDEKIIDTLLNTVLKDAPQRPKWVDGSGLSRYNLFTPQDFVYILNKIKDEFGMERIKNILPTGGTGTIAAYYKKEAGYIFVKTGTLSNNCALSGYLYTAKGKLLIFSILANNYTGSATPVRKATEKFLEELRNKY